MTIQEKYKLLRQKISDGDLIGVHGTGIVAKIIRWFDSSYYSHILVVVERHEALFCVDSNGNGVQADRLSFRINSYKKDADFTVIKPMVDRSYIDKEMKILLHKSDDNWIKYDFENGSKEMVNRKFKTNFRINLVDDREICSDYVSRYAINLGLVTSDFLKLKIAFPQDFFRYLDKSNTEILTANPVNYLPVI